MSINYTISLWDTNQTGASWDSGLQWDVNIGPGGGDTSTWLGLITSEHNQQPDFMTMLQNVFQPFADDIAVMASLPALFDLDVAAGTQLDVVGLWVGVTRNISVPLTGVYFSFDTVGLGFDQGTWYDPFNPTTGLVILSDQAFRTLIRARIANNQWDGTIPGAYDVWNVLFAGTDTGILIQDLQNMHMLFALTGTIPDAVTLALFTEGYIGLVPAGVTVDAYLTPAASDVPYFGFDVENSAISGFDVGYFGVAS